MSGTPRKICVVVASRANYARVKYLMKAIQESPKLELQLVVGASALLYKYGRVIDVIRRDGFEPNFQIHYLVEGENLITQAKSTGMGIIELSTAFDSLRPDVVITVADRFETMATAIAASYLNIPLAHVQGGEISGNIDDSVRHAITKLSHLHYPATHQSAERILRMGEDPWRVKLTGCPSIDILANMDLALPPREYFQDKGTGLVFDPAAPYLLVLQHPVTTSFGEGVQQITETLHGGKGRTACQGRALAQPGRGQRRRGEGDPGIPERPPRPGVFVPHQLPARDFCQHDRERPVRRRQQQLVHQGRGVLGTPAVIVGDRQEGREHGRNVVHAGYDRADIRGRRSRRSDTVAMNPNTFSAMARRERK